MKTKKIKIQLKEGEDYYLEGGLMVFTSIYHLRRGFCCQNNCRHCPYLTTKEKAKKIKSHQ